MSFPIDIGNYPHFQTDSSPFFIREIHLWSWRNFYLNHENRVFISHNNLCNQLPIAFPILSFHFCFFPRFFPISIHLPMDPGHRAAPAWSDSPGVAPPRWSPGSQRWSLRRSSNDAPQRVPPSGSRRGPRRNPFFHCTMPPKITAKRMVNPWKSAKWRVIGFITIGVGFVNIPWHWG